MSEKPISAFWSYSSADILKRLNTSSIGLSSQEVKARLSGKASHKRKIPRWRKELRIFIDQFKSPLMLLLLGAVVLSAFLGDTSDVFIILFIVLSTGLLSFFQERNAGRVVEQLEQMIAVKSTVLRDGAAVNVHQEEIVEGDVLLLKAGDVIPCDALLISCNELHTNEASLTGESFPVRKDVGILSADVALAQRTNCLWEGASVVSGEGRAVVIACGDNTLFGQISKSVVENVETSFEKGIRNFGFLLMKITMVLSTIILVVNLLNHKGVMESALFALALAVGMAPELLPAITTIAMSAGAKRLLQKKVIVKKLSSIQNLGEVSALCTDKTGTITAGEIVISETLDVSGAHSDFVRTYAYINALHESGYANPIDESLRKLDPAPTIVASKLAEVPYDFIRKRLSIAVEFSGQKIVITKGAFAQVLSICSMMRMPDGSEVALESESNKLESFYNQCGENGKRVIAVCYKRIASDVFRVEDECEMVFAGFVLVEDPVKPGILDTLAELRKLNVTLKIISGDNRHVAAAIARQLGFDDPKILTGKELLEVSSEALIRLASETHIFAEVEPQQKERIVHALRASYTVAYMGDGINDVSAIHAADVGISVDNAVDVAKEAADFVLLEKDLSVIVDGIKEGRKTFANTLKYIYINTGSTFGNMCSVAVASLVLPFLPMLPKQILLTNFITDFPYLAIASDNVDEDQLNKPGKWNMKIIRNYMVVFGLHSSLFDIITFMVLLKVFHMQPSGFQTGWFVESILSELFILFIIRTHKNFFKSKPASLLSWLSLLGLVLTIALPYSPLAAEVGLVPLPLMALMSMVAIVFAYVLTADVLKVWFFRRLENR